MFPILNALAQGVGACDPPRRPRRCRTQRPSSPLLSELLTCMLVALSGAAYAGPTDIDSASSSVTRSLLRAELALAANQLVAPAEDNALVHLERVLAEDPRNHAGAKLLDELIVRFAMSDDITRARRALARLKSLHSASSAARPDDGASRSAEQTSPPTAPENYAEQKPKRRACENPVVRRMQQRLVELKDCHVALGLAALQLDDPLKAGLEHQAAAEIAAQHRLEDGGVKYLSQVLEQGEQPLVWSYRVYGTF